MSQFYGDHIAYFESAAGIEFLKTLNDMINANHVSAENDPDKSRDYMQRAKGNREIQDVIKSLTIKRSA